MTRIVVAVVSLLLGATVSAQTASDLAARYARHEVYEVQPEVQMRAEFAANGLVCKMEVEQEHFSKDGVDMRNGIDRDQVDRVLDQLVPPSERGEKDKGRNGVSIATVKSWRLFGDTQTSTCMCYRLSRTTRKQLSS